MDPETLYALLKLRLDVFVVEQGAAYEELDGRDVEPGARLLWAEDAHGILATLRVLSEADGWRIGRVATAAAARGQGLAAELMRQAVAACAGDQIVLDAQQHLEHWYAAFGFSRSGEVFIEDGIPHLPMTRPAVPPAAGSGQGTERRLAGEVLEPVLKDMRTTGTPMPAVRLEVQGRSRAWLATLAADDGSGVGVYLDLSLPRERAVVAAAEGAQAWLFDQLQASGQTNWPPCPLHPSNHPLGAVVLEDKPVWVCPADDTVIAGIGALG